MRKYWEQACRQVRANKAEIINRLLQFARADTLLFWSSNPELSARQKEKWLPVLEWARKRFGADFETTEGLETPAKNEKETGKLKSFMEKLNDDKLTALYLAAVNMRSVNLGAALVEGKISADEAFEAAFLEELWQAEKWGKVPEAEDKRQKIKQELEEISLFIQPGKK